MVMNNLVGNFMMDQITKVNVNIVLIVLYNYVAGTRYICQPMP